MEENHSEEVKVRGKHSIALEVRRNKIIHDTICKFCYILKTMISIHLNMGRTHYFGDYIFVIVNIITIIISMHN
jgi:hypothetical protein